MPNTLLHRRLEPPTATATTTTSSHQPKCILHLSTLSANNFYFATISGPTMPANTAGILYFSIDDCIAYPLIQSYFGPPTLGDVHRYATMLNSLMVTAQPATHIVHCTNVDDAIGRTNAALLAGAYAVLCLHLDPHRVASALEQKGLPDYLRFRDTSGDRVNGMLLMVDLLQALQKAVLDVGLCKFDDFDVDEYDRLHSSVHEDVNMTWIVPDKLLAFMGPVEFLSAKGTRSQINPFFVDYFRKHRISAVIRCNSKMYDAKHFRVAGIRHYDLHFPDGTCPNETIMQKFFEVVETTTNGAVAVHCKAGLGRTGVLIGAYLMKHFGFTAPEATGWLRICRPGSVIGVQHQFLVDCEPWLRQQGRNWRRFNAAVCRPKAGIYGRKRAKSLGRRPGIGMSVQKEYGHALMQNVGRFGSVGRFRKVGKR